MEELSGCVENIIFKSEDNGFTVAKIKETPQSNPTIIVGYLPSLLPGETLRCFGKWNYHPSHGKQFEVEEHIITIPIDLVGIQKYLESGLVKGIGPFYAEKIVARFGLATLEIINMTPQRLLEVEGIGKKRLKTVISCWEEQKTIRDVMIFLRGHDVSPSYAQKIFKRYGSESIKKVNENPYQLAKEIFGIGFKKADFIAEKLGIAKTSSMRIESGIEYVLFELSNVGNTCYPYDQFFPFAEKILEIEAPLIKESIEVMVKKGLIVLDNGLIWLKNYYLFEVGIAKELGRIQKSPPYLRAVVEDKAIEWIQNILHIQLAEKQKEAILRGLKEKIHIITGGPGTGKSTITKAFLKIAEKLTNKIILAAPTGRAAKRLSQITGKRASTIHSLLEFDFANGGFKKNRENPLKCHLLIIDEVSMIDTPLIYNLLSAVPDECKILFIGDVDQLPSVGPGNILKDLIQSGTIGVTCLVEIFRQAQGSKIIANAHKINQGIFPELAPSDDFMFIEKEEPEEIQKEILSLIELLPKERFFHPTEDIQVLSPMKKGPIGIENLNTLLQTHINPSNKPFFKGGRRFHVGDKVMQIRNNYNKIVFNGDLGKIFAIDPATQTLSVNFDDKIVDYNFAELDEINLAYAVSVHKFQGSEFPCIIIPVHISHFKLLYRNLLYTAVTRGKKMVILIGSKKAVAIAVKNMSVQNRFTGLLLAIKREQHL